MSLYGLPDMKLYHIVAIQATGIKYFTLFKGLLITGVICFAGSSILLTQNS